MLLSFFLNIHLSGQKFYLNSHKNGLPWKPAGPHQPRKLGVCLQIYNSSPFLPNPVSCSHPHLLGITQVFYNLPAHSPICLSPRTQQTLPGNPSATLPREAGKLIVDLHHALFSSNLIPALATRPIEDFLLSSCP